MGGASGRGSDGAAGLIGAGAGLSDGGTSGQTGTGGSGTGAEGGTGGSDSGGTGGVVVYPLNYPPEAVDDEYTLAEGDALVVVAEAGLLANDTDPEGDPTSVVPQDTTLTNGTLVLDADGGFTYVHDGSETTGDTFDYQSCDDLDCSTGTVTLTITPVNDAPVGAPDAYNVDVGATLSVPGPGLLANDTDPEGDSLTVLEDPVSGPTAGTVTLLANGGFAYTNDESATEDSFTYELCDAGGACAVATVTILIGDDISVGAVDDDLTGTPIAPHVRMDFAAPGLKANDTGVTAVPVVAETKQTTGGGNVKIREDGSFSYISAVDARNTQDSFTYTLQFGDGDREGTVTVQVGQHAVWFVDPQNDDPGDGRDNLDRVPTSAERFGFNALTRLATAAGIVSGDLIVLRPPAANPVIIPTSMRGTITLPAGVRLIGNGVAIPDDTLFPAADYPGFAQTGTSTPTTRIQAPTGINGMAVISLAGDNVVAGLQVEQGAFEAIGAEDSSGNLLIDRVVTRNIGGVRIGGTTGAATITVRDSTIRTAAVADGLEGGITVRPEGNANLTVSVEGCTITDPQGDGVNVVSTGSSTLGLFVTGTTITSSLLSEHALKVAADETSTIAFDISGDNVIFGGAVSAVELGCSGTYATGSTLLEGVVDGNMIDGSQDGAYMGLCSSGTDCGICTVRVGVSGNQFTKAGLGITFGDRAGMDVDVHFLSNELAPPVTDQCLRAVAAVNMCLHAEDNTITNGPDGPVLLQSDEGAMLRIQQSTSSSTDPAQVITDLNQLSASVAVQGTGTVTVIPSACDAFPTF